MRIKMLTIALLAGLLSLTANAGPLTFGGSPSGYMNVFELDGVTELWGSAWGVSDLQTLTSDNLTFELHPNYNSYEDAVNGGDTNNILYWTDSVDGGVTPGPDGGKVLEAVTFFELSHVLTEDLTSAVFNYTVDSGTDLDISRFLSTGFIQVIDTNGNSVAETVATNNALGPVPLSLDLTTTNYTGYILQAGWRIKGQNANPVDAAAHGKMLVTVANLYAESTDTYPPTPVGFESSPMALSGTQMTMTAAEALDYYTVEYQFSNTTIGVSSDWQTNRVWVDEGVQLPATTNVVDLVTDPTYLDLGYWEGYAGAAQAPSNFVTVSSGVATVTPGSDVEWNFYKTFDGLNLGQAYQFSIVSDNDTTEGTTAAVAFVKAFDASWGFMDGEFQSVALPMDGSTTTINFTPVAGVHYQVGTFTVGTTNGSYDVSSPSLMTTNIVPGDYLGLTPDTEYVYTLRARDLSPQTNVSAWAAPVAGISTVFDVTAPTPDPMQFSTVPTAIGERAVSMIATTAVDDYFGVEYLFTNVTTGGSSGWRSGREWTDAGNLALVNADFESGTNGWIVGDCNTQWGWGDPSGGYVTNLSGSSVAYLWVDGAENTGGGYSVAYPITNVSLIGTGFNAGDEIRASADVKALAGLNGGGAGMKVEFYTAEEGLIGTPLEQVFPTTTEEWATYTISDTIPANAVRVKIVLLISTAWGSPNAFDSHYLFDNVIFGKGAELALVPGTEYTYKVKARDTSPVKNETAWSSPASVTTLGTPPLDPLVPFDITGSSIAGGDAVFTWAAISGHLYDVLYKTNLVTDLIWMTNETIEATADGTLSATTTVDGAAGFIRIQGR